MAITPETFPFFTAEIISIKGHCNAGHQVGDTFNLSCWNPDGLCGFFYHDIFPSISVFQFGGEFPWAKEGALTLECPDRHNLVTLKLHRG